MSASAETATASTQPDVRRRQWGAERQPEPLAIIHARPTVMKVAMGRIAIVVTLLAWAMYVITTVIREFIDNPTWTSASLPKPSAIWWSSRR